MLKFHSITSSPNHLIPLLEVPARRTRKHKLFQVPFHLITSSYFSKFPPGKQEGFMGQLRYYNSSFLHSITFSPHHIITSSPFLKFPPGGYESLNCFRYLSHHHLISSSPHYIITLLEVSAKRTKGI
jgi:hypothetical protein